MAFIDSTSSQRVELLRQAEKTANLTRRVTVGSGVLGAPEGVEGGELCTALSEALADIGYSGLPPGGAVVDGGVESPVLKLDGTVLATGTTLVEDNVFEGIELAQTDTTVSNGGTVIVQNSVGGLATNATATVTANTLNNVRLPATSTIVANSATVSVQNSAGANGVGSTAIVAAGVISAVRLPATTAALSNGATLPLWNSAGTLITSGGTLTVANGVAGRLNMPATVAAVINAQALTVPVTGTYTNTATFTVDGGVITGITLS